MSHLRPAARASHASAKQVTALLREPSGRIIGTTSNPGKIFALSSAPARRGSYESDVRDARASRVARAGTRTSIAFVVRDEQSPVQRVEYSLDGRGWRVVYPKDGIPDSRREDFEVTLEGAEAGQNLIIRATDAMNNVATAVADVKR